MPDLGQNKNASPHPKPVCSPAPRTVPGARHVRGSSSGAAGSAVPSEPGTSSSHGVARVPLEKGKGLQSGLSTKASGTFPLNLMMTLEEETRERLD